MQTLWRRPAAAPEGSPNRLGPFQQGGSGHVPDASDFMIQGIYLETSKKGMQACFTISCRENTAHIRQSRPDSGLAFQVKALKTFAHIVSSAALRQQSRYKLEPLV